MKEITSALSKTTTLHHEGKLAHVALAFTPIEVEVHCQKQYCAMKEI